MSGGQWHITCFDAVSVEDMMPADPSFRRGDCNADAALDLADAICVLTQLFGGGAAASCADALDSQDDGAVDIADAIFLLQYLFAAGTPLPAPGLSCGPDPSADALDCREPHC